MSNSETKDRLISNLKKVDTLISDPLGAVSSSILIIASALLLADMLFEIQTKYIALSLMVTSLSINLASRYSSSKAKSVVLELHGLKCGNCKKTPHPASIHSDSTIAYCPHCQLMYSEKHAKFV